MSTISSISSGNSQSLDFSQIQQSLFQNADTDGDGSITGDELKSILEKSPRLAKVLSSLAGTAEGSASSTEDIFKALDQDGDGQVSESEFKTGLTTARENAKATKTPPPPPPDEAKPADFTEILEKVFSDGDSDGDGYITESELQSMAEKTPGLAQDISTLSGSSGQTTGTSVAFSKLDADGDGKVSLDEFTSGVAQAHEQRGAQSAAEADGVDAASDAKSLEQQLLEALQLLQQQNGYTQSGTISTSTSSGLFQATA